MYQKFLPIIISALTVLILGMWNPSLLQKRVGGKPVGVADPKLLALAALGTGAGSLLLLEASTDKRSFKF
jgi:hypothetical protein